MVSTEPELDAEGRPRHSDPRDFAVPLVPERKRNWLAWVVGALVLLGVLIFAPRACSEARDQAPAPGGSSAAAGQEATPAGTPAA